MSPQLVPNRKIRPEGERLGCSEHQPFQKEKGEGARSGNLLFIVFIEQLEFPPASLPAADRSPPQYLTPNGPSPFDFAP